MDYLVRFFGHLDKFRRPAGFPDVVSDDVFVRVNNAQDLVQAINNESKKYLFGMSVTLNPQAMLDTQKADTNRVFVYSSILTHITFSIKPLQGEVPMVADDGHTYLNSGQEIVTH